MENNQTNTNKKWSLLGNVFEANQRFKYGGYINQCKACKNITQYGRRVILFDRLNLNASTDDFVFFGYVQFIGRSVCLLLLGMIISILLKENLKEEKDVVYRAIYGIILALTAVSKNNDWFKNELSAYNFY